MPQQRDQRKERRPIKMYDQHGRAYHAIYDKVGGGTTGSIDAWQWTAPLMPPQAYLKCDPESPSRVIVDYDLWLADIRERRKSFMDEGRRMAPLVIGYGSLKNDEWMNHLEMMALLGGTPPDDTLVRAAKAKNRWVLGKQKEVPEWAEKFVEAMKPKAPEIVEFPDADGSFGDAEPDDEMPEMSDEQLKAASQKLMLEVEKREAAQKAARKTKAA